MAMVLGYGRPYENCGRWLIVEYASLWAMGEE